MTKNKETAYKVLVLYARYNNYIGAISDYLNAFGLHSRHQIAYHDPFSSNKDFKLTGFDAVIMNYCIIQDFHKASKQFLQDLSLFKGVKIAVIQDEYDNALTQHQLLASLKIDCVVTNIQDPADYRTVYYGEEFATLDFLPALTGYVTDEMLHPPQPIPFSDRKWLIGYRGRQLPYKYGRLGWEKFHIGKRMGEICRERKLNTNIATDEASRIYAADWHNFIRNCRCTLGSESGSNLFDFDGTIKKSMNQYLSSHPEADFETIHSLFLKDHDGRIRMNQISPRVFEAIALGTVMILFEGEYSGVVKPWIHYIPLKKDFSNLDEVIAATQNISLLEELSSRAYKDIIASGKYSYASFISRIDDYIESKSASPSSKEAIYVLAGWRDKKTGQAEFLHNVPLNYPTPSRMLRSKDPLPSALLPAIKKIIVKYMSKYKLLKRDHASGKWILNIYPWQ